MEQMVSHPPSHLPHLPHLPQSCVAAFSAPQSYSPPPTNATLPVTDIKLSSNLRQTQKERSVSLTCSPMSLLSSKCCPRSLLRNPWLISYDNSGLLLVDIQWLSPYTGTTFLLFFFKLCRYFERSTQLSSPEKITILSVSQHATYARCTCVSLPPHTL